MNKTKKSPKFVFIMGGVVSSLGKGIVSSSLGCLLNAKQIKVFNLKCDPYLNVDPGTMSPYQHGEVYVTKDGGETDLDLGHYERFINNELTKKSNFTAGKIYRNVLSKERKGEYLGSTIQVIPHITDEIKENIYLAAQSSDSDVVLIEFGGTIGDIELLPFVEAARQIYNEVGSENFCLVFVTLAPYLKANKELKTKPIQHATKELNSMGLRPDILVIRSEMALEKEEIQKVSTFCSVPITNVIEALDVDNIYKIPLHMQEQNLDSIVCKQLKLNAKKSDLTSWNKFVKKIDKAEKSVDIAIVGKYVRLADAYLSVAESLKLAGYELGHKINIKWIDSRKLTDLNINENLKNINGILIPGGFGKEGINGKILATQYARENNIPFLGICLGMQIAVIEYAKNVLKINDADSFEWNKKSDNHVIDIIRGTDINADKGGTLRLGNFMTTLLPGSLAFDLYKKKTILERHRHRFEINNEYVATLEKSGMLFSGKYKEKNLCEIVEIPNHKFFIASQFHPEFTSRPSSPNPLFKGFVAATITTK